MAKKSASSKKSLKHKVPEFLLDLMKGRSPSGVENESQLVVDRYVKPYADSYEKDNMGNRIATLNPKGDPVIMLSGHMDEIGLMITYVDDRGFIYFQAVGGYDNTILPGRRVCILNAKGDVLGVTGRKAVHMIPPEERTKAPNLHEVWIDIGAKNKKEALQRIEIGDVAVFDESFEYLHDSVVVGRAFDDKAGCYAVCETLRRLSKVKKKLAAKVVACACTQEEVGVRGVTTAAFKVNPHFAIAVDVTHATDHPEVDKRKVGDFKLGAGPVITRGVNISPIVYKTLIDYAKKHNIPHQVEGEPRPTGTEARILQMTREGVATGLISIPLRYMHTPCEIADLNDIENTVRLLEAFCLAIRKGQKGHW